MGSSLRPWLLPFVEKKLRTAIAWREGNGDADGWEDTSSNLRQRIDFEHSSETPLQLLEFTNVERPLKCIIADGQTRLVALLDADVEASFARQHGGKKIFQVASGSLFTVASLDLVCTDNGNEKEYITFRIHKCDFESTTLEAGVIGRPEMVLNHQSIRSLHAELFPDREEDSLSQLDDDANSARPQIPVNGHRGFFEMQPFYQSANDAVGQRAENDNVQLQFTTQLSSPSKKRKRESTTSDGLRDNPPVDVKRCKNQPVQIEKDLIGLIPVIRPAKRTSFDQVRQGSREQSSPSGDESYEGDNEDQLRAEAREPQTTKSPGLIDRNDEHGSPCVSVQKVPGPSILQPAGPAQQAWHDVYETARNIFHIPRDQIDVLKAPTSWNPPPPGRQFPRGNLPSSVLLELQQQRGPSPSKDTVLYQSPQKKPAAESPSKSRPSSSAVSEIRTEDYAEEDDEELPWSPSQRDEDALPPNTSPNSPTKSNAGSDIGMSIPRALVPDTRHGTRNSLNSNGPTRPQERKSPGFDREVSPAMTQFHREIREASQDSKDSTPGARSTIARRLSPGENYSSNNNFREDLGPLASSAQQQTLAESEKQQAENDNSAISGGGSHERRSEVHSLESTKSAEKRQTPLIPVTPPQPPPTVHSYSPSPRPTPAASHKSSPNSRIVASVEQGMDTGAKMPSGEPKPPAQPKDSPLMEPPSHGSNRHFEATIPPTKATPTAQPRPISHTQPLRPSTSGRLSSSSATLRNTRRAVYQTFKDAYPEYKGDIEHFTRVCQKILEDHPHRVVWDDFLIRHLSEYSGYISSRLIKGRDIVEYGEYYDKSVQKLKYQKGVLTEGMLEAMFPAPAKRKSEGMKPKEIPTPLFLPNANTYWTGSEGWIVNGQSRNGGAKEERQNAF